MSVVKQIEAALLESRDRQRTRGKQADGQSASIWTARVHMDADGRTVRLPGQLHFLAPDGVTLFCFVLLHIFRSDDRLNLTSTSFVPVSIFAIFCFLSPNSCLV